MNSGRQSAAADLGGRIAAEAPHAAESPPQCPFRDVDDTPFDWAVIYSVLLCYSPVAAGLRRWCASGGTRRRRTSTENATTAGGLLLLLYRE